MTGLEMNTKIETTVSRNDGWGLRKRLGTGLNVLASLILAVAAATLLNYLAAKHFRYRCDISKKQFYSLSEKTRNILSTLKGDIAVHVVFRVSSPEKEETVRDILRLLEAYRQYAHGAGSLNMTIERVDPDRDLATTESLKKNFDLRNSDVVLFESAGRSRCIPERNIIKSENRWSAPTASLQSVKTEFEGEREFSSAILSLMDSRRPVVCFVKGHGEREVDDFTKGSGYSDISRALRFENIDVRSIRLTDETGIPADCDLLILAGPRKTLHRSETASLSTYLKTKHSMMVLLDSGQSSGLEQLMAEWGISLPDETVLDTTSGLSALLGTGEELYLQSFGAHPITANLADMTMILPRPVLPLEAVSPPSADGHDDKPRVTMLVASSESSWSKTDAATPPRYDPAVDRKGPVPVAFAVERGPAAGVNVELKPTRIVVVGDSDFIANSQCSGANEDFFINSANWLLERQNLVAVGPKSYEQSSLLMNETQMWWTFMIIVVAIPAASALAGIAVWLLRI